jgi:xanthine dehydrogenase YagS FAD-binding subunit
MLRNFAYVRANSLSEALKQLEGPGARVHAGGTDLIGCLRDNVMQAQTVVSIARLADLKGISTLSDGGLRIGALTTITEIATSAVVKEKYGALAQAATVVASPQLRNQGTIGGNLCQRPRCWYFRGDYDCARKGGSMCYAVGGQNQYHCIFGGGACVIVHPSDTAPALVALDAKVKLTGPKGSRTVALDQFFVLPDKGVTRETVLEPGEILTDVLLPPPVAGQVSGYRKVRARGSWDFALAGIALAVSMKAAKVEKARVVLSGVAPAPWRAAEVEKAIIGQRLDAKTVTAAAAAAVKGAAPLSYNGYKVSLVRGIVEEALLGLQAAPSSGTGTDED